MNLLRFHTIRNRFATELGEQATCTEQQFRKSIVHIPRGPAGTKDEEKPYKDREAIVPVLGDARSPRRKPFCGTASALIVLDLDDQNEPEIMRACGQLEKDKVPYVLWSTHSYGAAHKGDRLPCRIAIFCDKEYPTALVPGIRKRFAERYGLIPDGLCLQHVALFYLPSCPDTTDRKAMALVRHGYGPAIDPLRYVTDGDMEQARKEAEKAAAPIDTTPASPEQRKAAEERLKRLEAAIANNSSEHAHKTLNGVFYLAQHEAAGAFEPGTVQTRIEAALLKRVALRGDDDFARRADHVSKQISYGLAEPELPAVQDGIAELEAQIRCSTKHVRLSLDEVEQRILAALNDPAPLHVIATTTGSGKTRALIQHVSDRELYEPALVALPSHKLADEVRVRFGNVGPVHHRGVTANIPGRPVCRKLPVVRSASELGLSAPQHICPTCEYKSTCRAYRDHQGTSVSVHVAPHAMVTKLLKDVEDMKLYVDEEPNLWEEMILPSADLARAPDWTYLSRPGCMALEALRKARAEGKEPSSGLLTTISYFDPMKLFLPGVSAEAAIAHTPTARLLKVYRALRLGSGEPFRREGDNLIVRVPTKIAQHLSDKGGVVLTATPDEGYWLSRGAKITHIEAKDSNVSKREILYRGESTRRNALPGGAINLATIAPAWDLVIAWAKERGVKKLLAMTYKALAQGFPDHMKDQWKGELALAHYGGLVGLDGWKDFDGFVTLYDPRPGGQEFGDATLAARRELAQAHGRARDPSRTSPCFHLHVGQLVPLGWEGVEILRAKLGRPRKVSKTTG